MSFKSPNTHVVYRSEKNYLAAEVYTYANRPKLLPCSDLTRDQRWFFTCVRRLRLSTLPQWLWADTLCLYIEDGQVNDWLNDYLLEQYYPSFGIFITDLLEYLDYDDVFIRELRHLGGIGGTYSDGPVRRW